MTKIAPYAKALTAAVVTGLGSLYWALDDGAVTAQEWVSVAITTLAATAAVWVIPNKDTKPDQR